MGWHDRLIHPLPFGLCLPAVGQGILALECREADQRTRDLLSPLNHGETQWAARAERSLLRHLEGGCQVPIATTTEVSAGRFKLHGLVASLEGTTILRDCLEGGLEENPETRGEELASRLLQRGADVILKAIRSEVG
jgi:hydroxymethylbilane synthase